MLLMFVSECSNMGLRITRRVLDNYGERIGQRTWTMSSSREAESNIRSLLERLSSRKTSVACFAVDGFSNKHVSLRWIVGNKLRFQKNGRFAIKHKVLAANVIMPVGLALVAAARKAGYTHDIGKNTRHFTQKVKRDKPIADLFRHELLSYRMLPRLAGSMDDFTVEQEALLELSNKGKDAATAFEFGAESLDVAAFICASHHRLPAPVYSYANHLKSEIEGDAQMRKNLATPQDAKMFSWPALKKAGSIQALPQTVARRALAWYGRLSVMMADHFVSSVAIQDDASESPYRRAAHRRLARGQSSAMANSWQPLDAHLKTIGEVSGVTAKALLNAGWVRRLPALDGGELCDIAGGGPAYDWQKDAVREISRMKASDGGMIGFLMAGTGCGKTVAYAALCGALNPESTRMTVCLGLRALTLQTGDEYSDRLGLDSRQMSVLIGSAAVKKLHALGKESPKNSEDLEDYRLSVQDGPSIECSMPVASQEFNRDGSGRYLTSPVLVTTIDNLIGAASWTDSKWIRPALRLLSAPLVLDEIDQYDAGDMIPVVRLAFLTGLCGQPLVLSSATLPPALAKVMHAAYSAGWHEHAQLMGKPEKVAFGLFSEHGSNSGSQDFENALEQFNDFIVTSNEQKAKQRPRVAEVIRIERAADLLNALPESIARMHERHKWDHEGVNVSIGLVRFARISDVAWMTKHLANHEFKDHQILLIPYHSRMPLAQRSETERKLDLMLKRSRDPNAPAKLPEVVAAIKQMEAAGRRKLVILVVASPVEEVGRDHDFDWALIDPSSVRSIIQCVGRVMRHRRLQISGPNVGIFQFPCREATLKRGRYCMPGPEIKAKSFSTYDISGIAGFLFEGNPIHAGPCLKPREYGEFTKYENERLEEALKEGAMPFLTDLDLFLTTRHFNQYRFRADAYQVEAFYNPFTCTFKVKTYNDSSHQWDWITSNYSFKQDSRLDGLLFKDDLATIASSLAARLNQDPEDEYFLQTYMAFQVPAYFLDQQNLHFSESLGAFEERKVME